MLPAVLFGWRAAGAPERMSAHDGFSSSVLVAGVGVLRGACPVGAAPLLWDCWFLVSSLLRKA